jgi:uncharacterized protein YutE (UPF0331/DUF86 family)
MERVSREKLIKALQKTVGMNGLPQEAIEGLADYILEMFGFNEAISDESLDSGDRDILYMLEDEGILSTETDEVTIKGGKKWIVHYWKLRVDVINALASQDEGDEDEEYDIYEDEELWKRDGEE